MRETYPRDGVAGAAVFVGGCEAVFFLGLEIAAERDGTEDGQAGRVWCEPGGGIGKESKVAAEAVDDGAEAAGAVFGRE